MSNGFGRPSCSSRTTRCFSKASCAQPRGPWTAAIYTLLQTAKLNDVNPEAYLRDILAKITDGHPINKIDALTPWSTEMQR
jgi:hypothetical protein